MTFTLKTTLISLLLLLVLGVSACAAPAAPTLTVTAALAAPSRTTTPTAVAIPSRTPTALIGATNTPAATLTSPPAESLAPTPTDQPACIDQADFIADVTIPDGTRFEQGQSFTKTWRIKNSGTCTWNKRYLLVYLKGDQMSAPGSTELSETRPGESVQLSLDMIAPPSDGVYQGVYQFQDPNNKRFAMKDGNLWVIIVVGSGATPTPTATAGSAVLTPAPAGTITPSAPSASPTTSPTKAGTSGSCAYTRDLDFETQVITLINAARATNGLAPFTSNAKLSASALKHSIDMGCNSLLRHTGSDGSNARARVAAEGYSASSVQEGIYAQPPQYGGSPQTAVDWWLNDADHRPILLSATLKEIGAGYVNVPTSALGGYFTIDVAAP